MRLARIRYKVVEHYRSQKIRSVFLSLDGSGQEKVEDDIMDLITIGVPVRQDNAVFPGYRLHMAERIDTVYARLEGVLETEVGAQQYTHIVDITNNPDNPKVAVGTEHVEVL